MSRSGQFDPEPVSGFRLVPEHDDRLVQMTDNQVNAAVVVEVSQGQTAGVVFGSKIRTALGGDVGETALALVLQQHGFLPWTAGARVTVGMAVDENQVR